jgi:hypothetical protein
LREWFENKTVSVVGNAASLLSQNYGKEIDQAEVVVRINRGGYRFLDFRKHMGSRIDVWCMQNAKQNRNHFNKPHNRHAKRMQMDTIDVSPDFAELMDTVYSTEECQKLSEHLTRKPSTGLRVLDYVYRSKPKEMIVYGFDWKETFSWHERRVCVAHDFEEEKKYCMKHIFNENNCELRK